jgi:hypothetical protein
VGKINLLGMNRRGRARINRAAIGQLFFGEFFEKIPLTPYGEIRQVVGAAQNATRYSGEAEVGTSGSG